MAAAGGTATGPSSACKPGRSSTGAPSTAADSKLSNQVSTIVSLLSTLCRGSPVVTHVRNPFTTAFCSHRVFHFVYFNMCKICVVILYIDL